MKLGKRESDVIRIEIFGDEGFIDVQKKSVRIDLKEDAAEELCSKLIEELRKEGRYLYK